MLLTLFLSLTTSWSTFAVAPAKPVVCAVRDLKTIANAPPKRSQDGVGFCYSFITAAHLQEQYCKHKPGGCQYNVVRNNKGQVIRVNDDRLAVLDVALQVGAGALNNAGSRTDALRFMSGSLEVAPERCMPFDIVANSRVFPQMSYDPKPKTTASQLEAYYNRNKTEASVCPKCKAEAAILSRQLSVNISPSVLVAGLKKKTFPEFLGSIATAFGCKEKRIDIPAFKIVPSKVRRRGEVRSFIMEGLNKNRLVDAGVCIDENALAPRGNCRPHATMIQGFRNVCCPGQPCVPQYKLFDSFENVWMNPRSGDWVRANDLDARMEKWGEQPTVKKYKLPTLNYIEDK